MSVISSVTVFAGGLFGAPEPGSRAAGGLHTALGYWYGENKYKNSADLVMRQNQIYSEAGYGFKKFTDIYARVGISDFTIKDIFLSAGGATVTDKNDFKDRWSFFGTLGAKGFYPFNDVFGMGVFIQGTYYFENFHDDVSGVEDGSPFTTELKFKNLWDVCAGVGLQLTAPLGIKIYTGPYAYYSEARAYPRTNINGLPFAGGTAKIKSKSNWGGYGGLVLPLAKGFKISVEGQYAARFSAGAAVIYTY